MLYKTGDNKNSPDSINVMINYHYHSENRLITPQFPFMISREKSSRWALSWLRQRRPTYLAPSSSARLTSSRSPSSSACGRASTQRQTHTGGRYNSGSRTYNFKMRMGSFLITLPPRPSFDPRTSPSSYTHRRIASGASSPPWKLRTSPTVTPSPPRISTSSTFAHTIPTLTPPYAPNFPPMVHILKASMALTLSPSSASMPTRSASNAWGSTLTRLSPSHFARGVPWRSTRPTSPTVISISSVGGVWTSSSSTCSARWSHLQKLWLQ